MFHSKRWSVLWLLIKFFLGAQLCQCILVDTLPEGIPST